MRRHQRRFAEHAKRSFVLPIVAAGNTVLQFTNESRAVTAKNEKTRQGRRTVVRTPVLRALALAVSVASLVVVLFAATDAQGREQAAGAEFDGYELAITAPVELPGFGDATIWSLPGQHLQLFSDDSTPTVSLSVVGSGAIVGLENAQGLVALGIVPPGLSDAPDELLVSPASTALAIAALHPEVTAGDPDTYLSRLAVAARSDGFAEVAAAVDGTTPLAQWGPEQRAAVERMITNVVAASASVEPTCARSVVVGGPVVRCPGSTELQNLSARTVAVAGEDGSVCAIVPAASLPFSAADDALLRELVGTGSATESGAVAAPVAAPSPGVVDAQACGSAPMIFVDADENPDWVVESGRVGTWVDDTIALARYLGPVTVGPGDVTRGGLSETSADRLLEAGPLNATERLRAATRVASSPAASAAFELLPLTAEASVELDNLTDLLERLFV